MIFPSLILDLESYYHLDIYENFKMCSLSHKYTKSETTEVDLYTWVLTRPPYGNVNQL